MKPFTLVFDIVDHLDALYIVSLKDLLRRLDDANAEQQIRPQVRMFR